MAYNFKIYDGDTESTIKKRWRLYEVIEKADVSDSDEEVERILTFYASDIQHITVPPPPLPYRPKELDAVYHSFSKITSTLDPVVEDSASAHVIRLREKQAAQPHKFRLNNTENTDIGSPRNLLPLGSMPKSNQYTQPQPRQLPLPTPTPTRDITNRDIGLGPKCRLLIIDAADSFPAAIVQFYLEFLRVQSASAGDPWIFQCVQSVSLRSHDTLSAASGTSWVTQHDRKLTDKISQGMLRLLNCEALPKELKHILDALQKEKILAVSPNNVHGFDYIIALHENQVEPLKLALNPLPAKDHPRVLVLSIPKWQPGGLSSTIMTLASKRIGKFMEMSFSWKCPPHPFIRGPFRTRFVHVWLEPSWNSALEYDFSQVQNDTGCELHWTSHQGELNVRVVAIVGALDTHIQAELILDDILRRCNWGFVMTRTFLEQRDLALKRAVARQPWVDRVTPENIMSVIELWGTAYPGNTTVPTYSV